MEGTENPVIDAGQFLGEDGAFSDNWLEQAYSEDDPMRTDPTLKNTKSVRSLASQVVNAQKQIGQFSGGREFTIIPNEQSDENEIKEHRMKLGMPETPADYKLNDLQLPEGLPKDEKLAEHMADVLHKAGASTAIAVAVSNGYAEYMKSALEAAATQDKLDDAAANKELRSKLGAAYDKTMQSIGVLVNLFGNEIDPAETANLLKELPNDSFAAQLLGKIAAKFDEKALGIPPEPGGVLAPDNAMEKFNELIKNPYYLTAMPDGDPKKKNQAYHDELIQKGAKLMELATNKGGA